MPASHSLLPQFWRCFPPIQTPWTFLYIQMLPGESGIGFFSHSWQALIYRINQWFLTSGWPPTLTIACAHLSLSLGDYSGIAVKSFWPWRGFQIFRKYLDVVLHPTLHSRALVEFVFVWELCSSPVDHCEFSICSTNTFWVAAVAQVLS